MKGFINFILIVVLIGALAAGGVAAYFNYNALNEKDYTDYAKDGRMYTTQQVPEEDKNDYVRISEYELVRESENMRRTIKYYEKRLNKAQSEYDNTPNESNFNAVKQAKRTLNSYKESYKMFRQQLAQNISTEFFVIYMPILVLAAIGLILNARLEKRRKEK